MDIKHMQYFVTIVNADFNLSKAAKQLHITQPSLSILINDLEATYELKFLTKVNSRYTGLTPEGQILYQEAKNILTMFNNLEYRLDSFKDKHFGTINIGIPPIIISVFFNNSIPEFISKYPNINVHIIEEGANVLEKLLQEKKIDFAILVGSSVVKKDLFEVKLCDDTLAAFVSKTGKFSEFDNITFSDLINQELVLLGEDFVLNTVIKSKFQENGVNANVKFTSGQWDLLVQLVSDNDTVTILPKEISKKIANTNVVAKDFNPKVDWSIYFAYNNKTTLTPTGLLFKEFMLNFYK